MSCALIILAKLPIAGRVKTRLCPPCAPAQAAAVAEAALLDTFDAARRTSRFTRRVLVVERFGLPLGRAIHDAISSGFEVIDQRGEGLAERLANAFADVGGPAVLVGMDTPQLRSEVLDGAAAALAPGTAVLGLAPDGGFWLIGLDGHGSGAFDGVPMSTAGTGAAQRRRLAEQGLHVTSAPSLRDIDTFGDAVEVAEEHPHLRLTKVVRALVIEHEPVTS
jgi:rSAM/selenodomain-associated transferase 1